MRGRGSPRGSILGAAHFFLFPVDRVYFFLKLETHFGLCKDVLGLVRQTLFTLPYRRDNSRTLKTRGFLCGSVVDDGWPGSSVCLRRHRQPVTGVAGGSDSQVTAGAHTPETVQRGRTVKTHRICSHSTAAEHGHARNGDLVVGTRRMEGMSAPSKDMPATATIREVSKAALQEVASLTNNLRKSSFCLWSKTRN